jgi:hypothetical protein
MTLPEGGYPAAELDACGKMVHVQLTPRKGHYLDLSSAKKLMTEIQGCLPPTESANGAFESWAVLEMMGHLRMAGRVSEEERFGSKVGRIDVPQGDKFVTCYFTAASIYRLTPCTEDVARAAAKHSNPAPVHRYQLEYEWDG